MNKFKWLVLALCMFSFAQGVYGLGDASLWWDESLSHYRATKPISFILSNRINIPSAGAEFSTIDNHPPLYFILLRFVIGVAGDSEFALRFLSAAFGTLIMPLLYLCGKRLFDPVAGLLATVLGALSPLYLWYGQESRPYMLATAMGLCSFYALIRLLEQRADGRWAGLRWGGLYIASVTAMLLTHYLTFFLLAAEGVFWFLCVRWGAGHRWMWWLGVITAIVAVAAFAWGLQAVPTQSDLSGYKFLPLPTLLRDVFHAFTLGLSGDPLVGFRWLAIGLFILSAGLLVALRRRVPWRWTVGLLLCFLLPVAEMYALSFVRPAYLGVRHLMFASPFYYMLLGAGVAQSRQVVLYRRVRLSLLMGIVFVTVLAGMMTSVWAYRTDPQYNKENHRSWGRYLSEHVRPDDLVVVVPAPIDDLYHYYVETDALSLELPLFGRAWPETQAQLEAAVNAYTRIWVAFSSTPGWANPGNMPVRWLEEHATRINSVQYSSSSTVVQVQAFRTVPPLLDAVPSTASTLSFNFGDQLYLLGIEATDIVAGHALHLSLYWSAPQPPARDYRIALSLSDDKIDRQGFSWASIDYAPWNGTFPTTQWPASRVVRDDVDIMAPPGVPPGRYRLNISVYPADKSGPALPAHDLQNGQLKGLIVPAAGVQILPGTEAVSESALSISNRVSFRSGDLKLLGHSDCGETFDPGQVIALSLYWKALRKPRQDATFSLQLVDVQGQVQASRTMAVSTYSPSQWRQGEVIWEQYRFRIPATVPPGEYRLVLEPDAGSGWWPWNRQLTLGTFQVAQMDDAHVFDVPPMQHSLSANLDDQIELLGYDLEATTVRPGEVVSCTLYWRAIQEVNQNYTVFNHLVAADGQTWGQWDNQPQHGALPTTRWLPGQVIADPYQIPVSADAPAGLLQLRVGMYDSLTMMRLPVRDDQGMATGDQIVVAEVNLDSR